MSVDPIKLASVFLVGVLFSYWLTFKFGPWGAREIINKMTPIILAIIVFIFVVRIILLAFGIILPF